MSWWEDSFVMTGICVAFCELQNTFLSSINWIVTIILRLRKFPNVQMKKLKVRKIEAYSWFYSFWFTKVRIIIPNPVLSFAIQWFKQTEKETDDNFSFSYLSNKFPSPFTRNAKKHLQFEKSKPKLLGEKERKFILSLPQTGLWAFRTMCPSAPSAPAVPSYAIYRVLSHRHLIGYT